ncbi:hemicentin-2-like isoform X2 [Tubulanus polymorphus]|uniref:hemicentin-2-like isoform X2 n=1 Tax=Tubulanus polymorphus TaxID=672921 RepID=UPI003DA1D37E
MLKLEIRTSRKHVADSEVFNVGVSRSDHLLGAEHINGSEELWWIRWMMSSGNSEFSPVTHIPGFYEFPIKPDGTRDSTQLKVRPSRNNELSAKTPPENIKYACYAENDFGKAASNNVVVNEKYTGDFSWENLKVKPTLQVQEGLTTELKCNPPDSFPKRAIISWLIIKGYGRVEASTVRAITTDSRVMIGPNGNLFFSHSLPSDATKPDESYVCQYNNPAQGVIKQGSPTSIKVKPNPNVLNKPPALIANPPPVVSALERDVIDLYCISSAKPVATVSWRRLDGKPMPSNHSYSNGNVHLYLKNVAPSYTGEYECTVSNWMGSKTSRTRVEIVTLPKFTKKPVDSTYVIGDTARFECEATGNPTPTTEWLENLVPVDHTKNDNRLTVTANTYILRHLIRGGDGSVNTPDMRVVQCRASNIHGSIIANGYINVVLPLVMREPKPSDGKNASVMTFEFTDTVILPCKTESDPATIPQIEWLYNGSPINYAENQIWQDNTDNSLHIDSWKYITEEDLRGDYTCVARTMTPVHEVRCTYTLAFEDKTVRIPPSIDSVSKSFLVTSSERAMLTCKASGIPKPLIRWMMSSGNSEFSLVTHIPGFYEFPIQPDGTRDSTQLKVRPSRNNELSAKTPPENFKYACYAENDFGKAASNNVVVNEKYTGDFSPENLKVKPMLLLQEGSFTELKCNPPDSFPKRAIISWLIIKGYGRVEASTVRAITTDSRVMIGPNGNLFFSHILPSDATKPDSDETYVCQYNNAAQGTIKQGSPISIKVKPNPNVPNKPPALIANPPPVVSALERDVIDLYCISSAKPVATVSWRRLDGKPMPTNHSYSNGNVHLYLINVAPSYAGEYECTVSNWMGSKTSRTRVEIMTLPKFTKKPVDSTYVIGDTARFECEATGNPTPTTEWLENLVPVDHTKNDNRLTVTANTYVLRHLIRGGDGSVNTPDMRVVQCRASNIHGSIIANGYINVVLPLVMRKPKPSVGKNASVMTFEFTDTVILPCKTESDPATIPQIEWLYNGSPIDYIENQIWQDNADNSLHINSWKYITEEDLRGDYTCVARTMTPVQEVRGTYTLAFEDETAFLK